MAPALIAPDLTGLDASATLVRPPRLNRGTPAAAPKCPPTAELRDTLSGSPPTLSPKYFYDALGVWAAEGKSLTTNAQPER
jgi:hypothetical protein